MKHFRGSWKSVDPRDPRILLYEVSEDDKVLRKIEIFEDGRSERDSVEWHVPEKLKGFGSLVEGPFLSTLPQPDDPIFSCREITQTEFDTIWRGRRNTKTTE
jgi:hypothetical protein